MRKNYFAFAIFAITSLTFMSFSNDSHPIIPGYEWNDDIGDYVDIDECQQAPCLPGHMCQNTPGGFHCVCEEGCEYHNVPDDGGSSGDSGVCPNGGYQTTGKRTESFKNRYLIIDIKTNAVLNVVDSRPNISGMGNVRIESQQTVAYFCDGRTEKVCWECNRYVLR